VTAPTNPSGPPEPVSADEQAAFAALVQGSLPAVRSAVRSWRTGLTGLITLITTGVILTGRTATTDLSAGWRAAITVTIGGGLALAVTGLWHTLAAEAGNHTGLHTLRDIHARHASVAAYQVALANSAGRRLRAARSAVTIALGLLLTGILLTWWAPVTPPGPPAYLQVTGVGGTLCGTPRSGDGGVLRLLIPGAHDPVAVPLASITNLALVATCPTP
jgi:hypothetical protein